jgi:hypothetical protein
MLIEDCRRLAKSMRPEHEATLLEIGDAWDTSGGRSQERSRQGGTGNREIEQPPERPTKRIS